MNTFTSPTFSLSILQYANIARQFAICIRRRSNLTVGQTAARRSVIALRRKRREINMKRKIDKRARALVRFVL